MWFALVSHFQSIWGRGIQIPSQHSRPPPTHSHPQGGSFLNIHSNTSFQWGAPQNPGTCQRTQTSSFQNTAPRCQIYSCRGHTTIKCWFKYYYAYDTGEHLPQELTATTLLDSQGLDQKGFRLLHPPEGFQIFGREFAQFPPSMILVSGIGLTLGLIFYSGKIDGWVMHHWLPNFLFSSPLSPINKLRLRHVLIFIMVRLFEDCRMRSSHPYLHR